MGIAAHQMMIVLPMSAEGIQKVVVLSAVENLMLHVLNILTVCQDIVAEVIIIHTIVRLGYLIHQSVYQIMNVHLATVLVQEESDSVLMGKHM